MSLSSMMKKVLVNQMRRSVSLTGREWGFLHETIPPLSFCFAWLRTELLQIILMRFRALRGGSGASYCQNKQASHAKQGELIRHPQCSVYRWGKYFLPLRFSCLENWGFYAQNCFFAWINGTSSSDTDAGVPVWECKSGDFFFLCMNVHECSQDPQKTCHHPR